MSIPSNYKHVDLIKTKISKINRNICFFMMDNSIYYYILVLFGSSCYIINKANKLILYKEINGHFNSPTNLLHSKRLKYGILDLAVRHLLLISINLGLFYSYLFYTNNSQDFLAFCKKDILLKNIFKSEETDEESDDDLIKENNYLLVETNPNKLTNKERKQIIDSQNNQILETFNSFVSSRNKLFEYNKLDNKKT